MHTRLLALSTALVLALGALVALAVVEAPVASAGTTAYPVPTSSAGLGRIVAAPDGNLWFVEEDSDKVGRITPSGQISELTFPADSPGITTIKDLDIGADGTIWVLYQSGRYAVGIDGGGNVVRGPYSIGEFGQRLRVAPDGTVWVSVSYDEDYIVRIVGDSVLDNLNAPPCEGPLGRAGDGSIWCQSGQSNLIHVNADGSGGTTYPIDPAGAEYPYAVAPGPVGSIWFGRYFSGTYASSPDSGSIGYLDQASSATKLWRTGDRTAPADLVQGPDGAMWFTSIGAAKGIGHLTTAGRGALTQVGAYEPTSLAFGTDGAVWFTDSNSNSIVRVTTDQLQQTNVDPGEGSVLVTPLAGGVKAPTKPIKIARGRVGLTLTCPPTAYAGCAGQIGLRTDTTRRRAVTRSGSYTIPAAGKRTVHLRLTSPGRRLVPVGRTTKLRVELRVKGSSKAAVHQVVKVRR